MELDEEKDAARKAAYARRKQAHETGDRAAGAKRLHDVLDAYPGHILAGYMPMRTEIDPLPAMAAYHGRVCVPVIQGKGLALKFREWGPRAEMVEGEFGARIPVTGDWLVPQVLVVPLVAFDRRGYRLGYGGGFYDRTLAALRAEGPVTAIGFAWSAQEAAELPIEPTDQKLDVIVTEHGAIHPR